MTFNNTFTMFMYGVWPYLLGIIILILFLCIAASIAIPAFSRLGGGTLKDTRMVEVHGVLMTIQSAAAFRKNEAWLDWDDKERFRKTSDGTW